MVKENSVFIKCDCGLEAIEIANFEDEREIFLNFWIMSWYSHNIWYEIKQRIRMAWNILRKGSYKYQEIILTQDKARELKEQLEKVIE